MPGNWHIVDNNHNNKANDRLLQREDLAWSYICCKEKEPFSWQGWLHLVIQHSSSKSSPATSQAWPLVSCMVPVLILLLQNYWYCSSSLRLDKRTGVDISGVVGLVEGLSFLYLSHCSLPKGGEAQLDCWMVQVGSMWLRRSRGSLEIWASLWFALARPCYAVPYRRSRRTDARWGGSNHAEPILLEMLYGYTVIILFSSRKQERKLSLGGEKRFAKTHPANRCRNWNGSKSAALRSSSTCYNIMFLPLNESGVGSTHINSENSEQRDVIRRKENRQHINKCSLKHIL